MKQLLLSATTFTTYGASSSYLEFFEVVRIPRPVDLREEVVVQHFAEQLEEVHLDLVERLVLQQLVQLRLPLLVVERRKKLADPRRNFASDAAAAAASRSRRTSAAAAKLEILQEKNMGNEEDCCYRKMRGIIPFRTFPACDEVLICHCTLPVLGSVCCRTWWDDDDDDEPAAAAPPPPPAEDITLCDSWTGDGDESGDDVIDVTWGIWISCLMWSGVVYMGLWTDDDEGEWFMLLLPPPPPP